MGIAGAGNSGTVLAVLLAPPLAQAYGWHAVYGMTAIAMLVPLSVMAVFAKEPPDAEHQSFKEHIQCLWQAERLGLQPRLRHHLRGFHRALDLPADLLQPAVRGDPDPRPARLTMLAALMGSGIRIVGGYFADRIGGIPDPLGRAAGGGGLPAAPHNDAVAGPDDAAIHGVFRGAGGRPTAPCSSSCRLRWPNNTAVAGSMIVDDREIGALGGAIIPNAMGLSKQYTGSFATGFAFFAVLAAVVLVGLTDVAAPLDRGLDRTARPGAGPARGRRCGGPLRDRERAGVRLGRR